MSQIQRNDFTNDLYEVASLDKEKVNQMTDAEVEYYHWLYLEESVFDLM